MYNMKKILILASVVIGMVTGAFAQAPHSKGTPEEKAQRAGNAWQKKLSLSDEEKSKFIEAKKAHIAKIQELRKTKPVDKTAVAAAKTDFDNAVKTAFTPEHYAAWQKTKEELKKKHAERRTKKSKKKGGPKGKAKPADDEDLDDDDDHVGDQ